ncbi:glycosyltransferase family 4 protein [Flavobacterium sp.]|uniref:glycosyltransferase family 4 protein n=1 Tax=Flavobacterium sp. TaxID=239 RepID=UPI00352977D5
MFWATLTQPNVSYILIDTYSTKAFWYAFICSQVARFRAIPYIPILHGGDLPKRLQNNPKLCSLIFTYAYKNVAPSNYLKSEFEKLGFENIIYIPNSIELEKYKFQLREKIEPKLLWVRAFAEIYNPKMAIKVLQELSKTYPNTTLTMVGPDKDGSMQTTKQLANELGLFVTFTGKLSKEKWWKLSQMHDVFINTTHFDNTPVSIIEAMALGLPIVSTNVGGIPFLLEHTTNALLVNDNDAEGMVKAIDTLLKNPMLVQNISKNARNTSENYDWQKVKLIWNDLMVK